MEITATPPKLPSGLSIRRVIWIDHLPLARPSTGLLTHSSSVSLSRWIRKCSRSERSIGVC
ncbi:hypothetical protein D9M71_718360 [compost metagenome]